MKNRPLRLAEGFRGERLTILPPAVVARARSLPVSRDLCVTHIGHFEHVAGHFVSRPKGRAEHILIVCLAGRGRMRIGPTLLHLHKGHCVILPPRVAHAYEAEMDDPWSLFWFHFTGARAPDHLRALGVESIGPRFWVPEVELLRDAFEECYRYVLGGYSDAELVGLSTGFARLLGLGLTLRRSPRARRRHTESRILRSLVFLRANLDRPITVREMAAQAGLSVPHFSAVFKRQLNTTPVEFHIRLRLQRACELLETRDHTVAEIAGALGYDDPLYFSRLFSRKIGASPRAYRAERRLSRADAPRPAPPGI